MVSMLTGMASFLDIIVCWISQWNRMWSLMPKWLGKTSSTAQTLRNVDFSVTGTRCVSYVPGFFVVLFQCWFCPWESQRKLESSFAEKDLGVPVISKLSRSQKGILAAKMAVYILSYVSVNKSVASSSRAVILPLYFALTRPHLDIWSCLQLLSKRKGLPYLTKSSEWPPTRAYRGQGKTERTVLAQPYEEMAEGDSLAVPNYLLGAYVKDWARGADWEK